MADWIDGLALGLSTLVAFVQFTANRPVVDLEPDSRHQEPDDFIFVTRVRNDTPTAIQIRRHKFLFSGSSTLMAPFSSAKDAMWAMTRAVNFWLDTNHHAELQLSHEPGKWLILVLRWRRASGLHLASLLPLLVIYSPRALRALKAAQTKVPPLRL